MARMTNWRGGNNLGAQIDARRQSAEARGHLADLKSCLQQHEESYWGIGDHLIALVGIRDQHGNKKGGLGFSLKELAGMYGYKTARLCQIYRTALSFKPEQRTKASFYDHELARKAVRSFPLIATDLVQTVRELSKAKIMDTRTRKPRSIRTIRDLSQYYAQKRARLETASSIKSTGLMIAQKRNPLDQCFAQPFQEVVPELIRQNIRFNLIFADPPYIYPDENVYRGGSVARRDCDSRAHEEALAVTLDILRMSESVLAPNGCLLLCQPAGGLLLEIMEVIRDQQLEVYRELIWDKRSPMPGGFDEPYTTSTERVWVIRRAGEDLRNHDLSSRAEILVESPVGHDPAEPLATHQFQKPRSLCRRLLLKHTYEAGLVFEPFGCSGEMSLAAIEAGRHFVYCESQPANYAWGSARIRAALKSARHAAG